MSERARPAVVLVRPTEEGNVGATARAMANMGLWDLVLVEPAPPIGRIARMFAVGAGGILDRVRRVPDLATALAPYRRLVGTTSSRERLLGHLAHPRELPAALAADPPGTPTALVFGPEASGLTNDELAPMHPIVRVPCALEQPTLNLAQAVLLVAWELRAAELGLRATVSEAAVSEAADQPTDSGTGSSGAVGEAAGRAAPGAVIEGTPGVASDPTGTADASLPPAEPPATAAELEGLRGQVEEVLAAVGFARDDTAAGVVRDLRRLASRAALTSREVTILRGICRRTLYATRGR